MRILSNGRGATRMLLFASLLVAALSGVRIQDGRGGVFPVQHSAFRSASATSTAVAVTFTLPPTEQAPAPPAWNWQYDDEGRVARLDGPGGAVASFEYGAQATAPAGVIPSGERRVFTFDDGGRLSTAAGAAGAVAFEYGAAGAVSEVRADGVPSLRHTHDIWGRVVETRIGDRAPIRRRYDHLGRPAAIETPAGEITFEYDMASNTVVRRLPSGVRSLRTYDVEGKLAELTHADARGRVIVSYAYTYRPDALIAGLVETSQQHGRREWRYRYDLMHRLIAVEHVGSSSGYTYRHDTFGNVIESQIAADRTLRFASTPAGALSFDSRGPSRVDARGFIRRLPVQQTPVDYAFNSVGELTAVNGGAVRYSYNALGLLVSRAVNGRVTRFLPDPFVDGWRPLWERDPDGAETIVVWDGALPLMRLLPGGDVRYQLEDHLGSIRTDVDGSGRIVAAHDYTPYGEPFAAPAGTGFRPGFAGLFWDPEARVYHTPARAYDPVSARFLQPDPKLRIPDDAKENHSLYAYAAGDPINFVDLNGREPQPPERVWVNAFLSEFFGGVWRSWTDHAVAIGQVGEAFARHGVDGLALGPQPGSLADQAARYGGHRAQVAVQALAGTSLAALGVASGAGMHRVGASIVDDVVRLGLRYGSPREPFHLPFLPNAIRYTLGNPHFGIGPHGPHIASGVHHLYRTYYYNSLTGSAVTVAEMAASAGQLAHRIAPLLPVLPALPSAERAGRQAIDHFLAPPVHAGEIAVTPRIGLPSPVGGVFLGGAGGTLEGFGRILGVATDDATGQLVLIGSDERRIALPPLRLADVVTVFRAVFEHGQPPTVTIDPDERNPTGPLMRVKHGPATASTYVGWVLYECDRIMKTYQLGQDNVTRQPVRSRVEGHARTTDAVYFDGPAPEAGRAGRWERFWIVPAMTRVDADANALSLFELPLKVRTQRMRWERGRLVDDERAGSSPGAAAFTEWFSAHYDEIAGEVLVMPPPGSGIEGPVAVFHELRRIAMLAAVAERLRDTGQRMPAWMHDYPVASFPIPEVTPSLTVEKTRPDGSSVQVSTIYGGVDLAPADRDVQRFEASHPSASVPREHAAFVGAARQLAASLGPRLHDLARASRRTGSVHKVDVAGGPTLSIALLPGADTRDLAPNRQQVTDLRVPAGMQRGIALTRHYNSFFDLPGELGRGWTLDLPQLVKTRVPVRRDGTRSHFRLVPRLVSPLRTVDVVFDETATVQPYGVQMSVAKGRPDIAGLGRGHSDIAGAETDQVLFRDGSSWHFAEGGALVLVEAEGAATLYVRERGGRIIRIVGYAGTNVVAEIHLTYDTLGRIAQASGTIPGGVTTAALGFEYNADGRLSRVMRAGPASASSSEEWTYAYRSGRLARVAGRGRPDQLFEYDDRGRLLRDTAGDRTTRYEISTSGSQVTLTADHGDGASTADRWVYDTGLRPLEATLPDGSTIRWEYGTGREVRGTLLRNGRTVATRTISVDGRVETIANAGGPVIGLRKEASTLLSSMVVDGIPALSIVRRPDGAFAGMRTPDAELHVRRQHTGAPSGLLISAPMNGGTSTRWLEEHWDGKGQAVGLTDSSGVTYQGQYDAESRLIGVRRTGRDGNVTGSRLTRDGAGRITRVDSPMGTEQTQYTAAGTIGLTVTERQAARATTSFDDEQRPLNRVAFDGGRTTWRYEPGESGGVPRRIELADGGRIEYAWSGSREQRAAEITFGTGVVRTMFDAAGRPVSLEWAERAR